MEDNLERPGYQFVGWYIDEQRTKRINPGGKLPGPITLYDKWVPILYPVRYKIHGGINSRKNPKYVSVESGCIRLHPAKKHGMCFAGWKWKGKFLDILPENISETVVLEAVFRSPYLVSFETNGGGRMEKRLADQDGFLEGFPAPMRPGYEFAGWYWDKDCHWPFTFDQAVESDCTLYAGWSPKTYDIVYHLEGGYSARSNPKHYIYSDLPILLKPAWKDGFRFLGWKDSRGRITDGIPAGAMGRQEFTAVFEEQSPGM
jgi:uncharacterized repeat protein (TIGR02543 family)